MQSAIVARTMSRAGLKVFLVVLTALDCGRANTMSRTLFELGLVVVLAALAPLIAQVLRLPSILVLLALGFGAGAIGAINPNALLGQNLVSATVSIAVGIILFDSGLALNVRKLTGRGVVHRLLSIGILVRPGPSER